MFIVFFILYVYHFVFWIYFQPKAFKLHLKCKLIVYYVCEYMYVCMCGASENGPAAPILAGPVLLKVKMKFSFYKKQVLNKSAGVIFRLLRLIIVS